MDRAQKSELVEGLNSTLSTMGVVVVTRSKGLTVKQSTDLRKETLASQYSPAFPRPQAPLGDGACEAPQDFSCGAVTR